MRLGLRPSLFLIINYHIENINYHHLLILSTGNKNLSLDEYACIPIATIFKLK